MNKVRILVGDDSNDLGSGAPSLSSTTPGNSTMVEDTHVMETCAVWSDPPADIDHVFTCLHPLAGTVVSVVVNADEAVRLAVNEMDVYVAA